MASTAPAYSVAATLGFVVVIIAFIPMFFAAWAIKLMNKIDPDCGTSFAWAARALGPRTGWFAGGFATIASFSSFMATMLLMVFIYWGWDTTTSVNEESEEPARIPGNAGVISTFLLLGTYLLVIISAQSFAGLGTKGIGLGNTNNQGDVLSPLGG
ncbi:MAG: hypothetical protein M3025_07760, partial [Actinomycetota bacterium]|nr:hypothetical protein [Actinomycetota bacterium]